MDNDVHLKPMDPERLAAWNAAKRAQAEGGMVRIGTSPEAGGIILDVTMDDVPPSPSSTTEQYMWSVFGGENEIGSAWVRMHRRETDPWAYVYEFDIHDDAGPQVGSSALAALESESARCGASHIQLKAPADSKDQFKKRDYKVVLYDIAKPIAGAPLVEYPDAPEVRLQPLGEEQRDVYLEALSLDLADASPETSPEQAGESARRQIYQLTQGPLRPKLQAFLGGYQSDELVGRAWIVLEQRPDGLHSFTNDMRVDPGLRARGYGRGFMAALYAHLRELGVITSRARVYGSNSRALEIFEQAGYSATHLHLRKKLAVS